MYDFDSRPGLRYQQGKVKRKLSYLLLSFCDVRRVVLGAQIKNGRFFISLFLLVAFLFVEIGSIKVLAIII